MSKQHQHDYGSIIIGGHDDATEVMTSVEAAEYLKMHVKTVCRLAKEKKIPANSKEIAIARSYGDLSENHEYKAAKEMQKLLMRRKADLETQLVRARGTDYASPRLDVASIGTIVQATDLATNQPENFAILGAWDSDPDKDIVSYLSPVAQSLLGHKVGDEVEFEVHSVRHHHRIESIQPFKPGSAPSPPASGDSNPGIAT